MSNHFDITRHFKELREQGATIVQKSDGFMVRSQNGGQVSIHHTHKGENKNTYKRTLSQLSKIGLTVSKGQSKGKGKEKSSGEAA